MAEFVMPSLGADMEAGTLVAWLKQPGDQVQRGDIIAEVDTDKGVIEVEVFTTGVVERLLVEPGTKVPVGTPLAIIREEGASATPQEPSAAEPAHRVAMSPSARKLARELSVDPSTLHGTGPGGAITREDVERAGREKPAAPPDAGLRMRQAIAAAMSRSNREIPHYYVLHTIDMSRPLDWLTETNAQRAVPDRLIYSVLLLKAVALALRDFPELNGRFEDGKLVPSPAINVGSAVSLRGGGLVIPALLGTDASSLDELMRRLRDLVERARQAQLRSSELSEGTITVTSLGERGVEGVLGVIYPPQVALVGFGKICERPWVVDGLVLPRPLLEVTLAADHRASDGHRGALFLRKMEDLLMRPASL